MRESDTRARVAFFLGFCLLALAPQAAPADEPPGAPADVGEFDDEFLAEFEDELGQVDERAALGRTIADPLKGWNKVWFYFNDKLYFWVMKPVAKGYGFILPEAPREGVQNFFQNLGMPGRFVNCLFQGRLKGSGIELARFGVNITAGVLGFFDPAHSWLDLHPQPRDTDQTLAKARIGKGFYLVWPLAGPSSVRGTFGLAVDAALNPATYFPGVGLLAGINDISLGNNPYESLVEASINPYVGLRNGYVQYRDQKAEE
jgi:phospholipid-binding lipoprotein MlaA